MTNFKRLIILILITLPAQAKYQYVCNDWTGRCENMDINLTENSNGNYRLTGTNYDTGSPIYSYNMQVKSDELEGYIQETDINRPGPNIYRFKLKD